MPNLRVLYAAFLAMAPLYAQDAPKRGEVPADREAYTAARNVKDPEPRIEALEKVIADYPKASFIESARFEILATMIKEWPDKKDRILKQAETIIAASKLPVPPRINVATRLLDAGILLKEAEAITVKAIKVALTEKQYLEQQRKEYSEREQKLPSVGELVWRYNQDRATALSTLGRIRLKLGDDRKAEKALKAAYKLNPNLAPTALPLADLAEKKGKTKQAVDYLVTARLAGTATVAEAARKLEAAYRKSHNGSADGLEEMLDAEYRKRFPPPVHAETYQPTAARSDRVVLVEMFTGAGCPPCVSADLAFDAALERYSRKDLAVIMYHLHIPRPDPMTNEETQNREKFYAVNGVPTYLIDGVKNSGGGPREYTPTTWDKVRPMIEKQLETPAGAALDVEARMEGPLVRVKAAARDFKTDARELKIHVVLVEEHIRYSGENGIRFHSMVVRSLGGSKPGLGAEGFALDPARPAAVEHTFDLKQITADAKKHLDDYEVNGRHGKITFLNKLHEIDSSGLAVVAFVQDPKTQAILQAQYQKLGPARISQAR